MEFIFYFLKETFKSNSEVDQFFRLEERPFKRGYNRNY